MDATGSVLGHFLGQLAQLGKDFGILFGEIFAFSDILFQIVEFLRFGTVILPGVAIEMSLGPEVLPLAEANARPVEVEGLAARFRLAHQQIRLIDSVDPAVRGRLESAQPSEGGQEIDGSEDRIRRAARGHLARPADDAGQTVTALIGGTLPVAQRTGVSPEDRTLGVALLFQGVLVLVPGPVVRGVDHQGVFAQLEFVQNVKQAPGLVIELLHHIPVEPPWISPGSGRMRR